MGDTRIKVGLPPDVLAEVDRVRGEVARERWIRGAIELRLGGMLRAPHEEADPKPPPYPRPVVDAENTPHRKGRPNTPGHPLLDHGWVGIGQTCMRVGCEAPKDRGAHGQEF